MLSDGAVNFLTFRGMHVLPPRTFQPGPIARKRTTDVRKNMRRIHVLAATGITAAMVAVPLPSMAVETTDAATGDLVVTRFDDRYADGLFDTTRTAPSGD